MGERDVSEKLQLPAGARLLYDIGNEMLLVSADLNILREQDLNARVMPPEQFETLVTNIRRRGIPESVPYCVLRGSQIRIVSGHHRVRAAKEAGIKEAVILLDTRDLPRSLEVAKQLAHNSITGRDR